MSPGARRPHQVRTYLEAELYERVLREAAVQRQSVSECVHDALEELYAIRDELSRPLDNDSPPNGPHSLEQSFEHAVRGLAVELDVDLRPELVRQVVEGSPSSHRH